MVTREPRTEFVASGEIGYSNYDTVNGKLYVSGPINEKIREDISLTRQKKNKDWGQNVTLDREIKKHDYWGAKSKIV